MLLPGSATTHQPSGHISQPMSSRAVMASETRRRLAQPADLEGHRPPSRTSPVWGLFEVSAVRTAARDSRGRARAPEAGAGGLDLGLTSRTARTRFASLVRPRPSSPLIGRPDRLPGWATLPPEPISLGGACPRPPGVGGFGTRGRKRTRPKSEHRPPAGGPSVNGCRAEGGGSARPAGEGSTAPPGSCEPDRHERTVAGQQNGA
jgi:hypothetical protein